MVSGDAGPDKADELREGKIPKGRKGRWYFPGIPETDGESVFKIIVNHLIIESNLLCSFYFYKGFFKRRAVEE